MQGGSHVPFVLPLLDSVVDELVPGFAGFFSPSISVASSWSFGG